MIYLTILISLIYFLLVIWLIMGYERTTLFEVNEKEESNLVVSIIIPVRNEAANILNLLEDISLQDYPLSMLEVLVVDDFSTDGTNDLVREAIHQYPFSIHLIELTADLKDKSNKKKAIETAINESKGSLIVTTDGDCRVGKSWIRTIVQFKNEYSAKLIAGPVEIYSQKGGIWSELQSIEFGSLIGSGAACINWGVPTMCNGANLAYEKNLFYEVKGFEGNDFVPSGDDEFLMHKVHEKYPKGVYFLKSKEAVVTTFPQKSLDLFLNQRIRWAGKWSHYQTVFPKILALLVFIFNFSLLVNAILVISGLFPAMLFLEQLILKIFAEFVFLRKVTDLYKNRISIVSFLLLELVYPIYVVIVALAGLRGQYRWKERLIK